MAFKLTYTDGQADDYDDSTAWAVEDGVLKMGREAGKWSVLVSPSHWATIEVGQGKEGKEQDEDGDESRDRDKKKHKKEESDEMDRDKENDRERDQEG